MEGTGTELKYGIRVVAPDKINLRLNDGGCAACADHVLTMQLINWRIFMARECRECMVVPHLVLTCIVI